MIKVLDTVMSFFSANGWYPGQGVYKNNEFFLLDESKPEWFPAGFAIFAKKSEA